MHKELWRVLGANPTPMGWPIYSELQQGAIDAQENPIWVIAQYKLHEVQQYMTLTGHVYSAHIDVASLDWFNSLPEEDQRLLTECMREAAVYQRADFREKNRGFLAELKDSGMQVNETPDLDSFRQRAVQLKDMPIFSDPTTSALLEKFLDATQ